MKKTNIILLGLASLMAVSCSAYRGNQAVSAKSETGFYTPPNWQRPLELASADQEGFKPNFQGAQEQSTALAPPTAMDAASGDSFQPNFGQASAVKSSPEQMEGFASWYGPGFHGKHTANGENYDQNGMTAAHRILPMDTWVKVTNQQNGKSIVVRINDRGPYKKNRILDLTKKAAKRLDYFAQGTAPVTLQVLKYPKGYDPKKGLTPYKQVVVQIAAFNGQDRAEQFKERLASRYREIPFLVDDLKEGSYHVVAGPYDARDEAKGIAQALKRRGVDNIVRSYRK